MTNGYRDLFLKVRFLTIKKIKEMNKEKFTLKK